jgi:hypothetical protein
VISHIVLTDPTCAAPARDTLFERAARAAINDPRDVPFVRLVVLLTTVVLPSAAAVYASGRYCFYVGVPYLALLLWFVGPFILMLHNTSHRRLFNRRWAWLNTYVPWVLGPFFGESPETYFAHHVGMHHPENNLESDLSSTMGYQRDSKRAFARYLGSFLLRGLFDLYRYFTARGRRSLARRMLAGELVFLGVVAALMFVAWRPTIVVFVVPFVFTRASMMAGNWAQHAFIDAASPGNSYRNSITCINTTYNRRCFNDGYHIGHHLKQTRHWTELPEEFLANRSRYAEEGAIVFEGVDFFGVWLLLMMKRYATLARRVVRLDGDARTHAKIEALLRDRTRRISPRSATRPQPSSP